MIRILQAILLSLLIHIFFVLVLEKLPAPSYNETKNRLVEVEFKSSEPNKNRPDRPLVRQTTVPEPEKVSDSTDKARFLSLQEQRVRQEMKSAKSGMTQNRSEQQLQTPPKTQAQTNNKKLAKSDDKSGIQTKNFSRDPLKNFKPDYKPLALPRFEEKGISTVGEALPDDMAVGSFTALNTDRYLYYSFFARIEELIRFRWESRVHSTIDRIAGNNMPGTNTVWVTDLEIWLKSNGEFHSQHLMKSSGISGFDMAAINAFREAKVFPNPPKEMIDRDGLIRLKYTFQVRFDPRAVVFKKND